MAHIQILNEFPGIRGLMVQYPDTGQALSDLAETLLHAPNTLSPGERELIATYVSSQNDCYYCQTVHGAVAACHLQDEGVVEATKKDFEQAAISDKLKALLVIAGKVQQGGKKVSGEDIQRARDEGASDKEIHDTVLIAAAFCLFNRYVDGLATWAPQDPEFYRQRGVILARDGYLHPQPQPAVGD
jgi:uncharacterized peroxidase-related enzyme